MGQIAKHPVLLDELLSSDGLGRVPESTLLNNSLQQQGLRIAVDDLEEHMLMLRYFRLAHHLHIVAAEVSGKLPLMKISDYLSFLADAILTYVMRLSWSQMVARYGYPTFKGEPCTEAEFAIIAYGKLGGLELSHNSDLDLVFLYRADDFSETDGDNPVENRVFFTRMGQRIIHILSTQTILGPLYEVDMRLRPSGGKGLLVSNLKAFDKYQSEQAWTWEHQALVRGRAVAGEIELIREFQVIRQRELQRPRDAKQLAVDVRDMRLKMYEHLTPTECKKADAEVFHLKHSRGGIVDIEFMVQYCVLAFSKDYPELLRYTDNIRILERLAKTGLIPAEKTEKVIETYRYYRSLGHRLALKQAKSVVDVALVQEQRETVLSYWEQLFSAVDAA
jgi:glutamate-ammonia-ligase adenylyltransferase